MSAFPAIMLAVSAFIATNVDDVFILVGFMSDPFYRLRDVILGQFLGVAVMTLLCVLLARMPIGIPPAIFGWLGFLEIGIGVRKLYRGHATIPQRAAHTDWGQRNDGLRTVTLATIGGFGDNVGVYVPLFAGNGDVGLFLTVFGVMTGLWCLGAYWLTGRNALGAKLRDLAAPLLPWMLIAIGIVIISRAGSLALLLP